MQLVLIIGILIINIITLVLAGLVLINKKSNEYYNKKIILSSNADDLTEGMFGTTLTWILEILESLEKKGYTPKDIQFDINTKAYGKIIPGILNPKDNVVGKEVIDMVEIRGYRDDIYKLKDIGCYGAITGKAIYEERISMEDLIEYMIKVEF